jgi:hypothetical protein
VKRSLGLVTAGVLLSVASLLQAGTLVSEVDGLRVEVTSVPSAPRTNVETEYVARLADRAGHPVGGARMTLRGGMADGMSVVAPLRPTREAGIYRGRMLFTMEGRWELTLRVTHGGKRYELPLTEHVVR